MKHYRISKYNPINRNAKGHYLYQDEWTCFSEVGLKVSLSDYQSVEQKYLDLSLLLFEELIPQVKVTAIENYNDCKAPELSGRLDNEKFLTILQNILRNNYWCLLLSNDYYVGVGYDYYMYVGYGEISEEIISEYREKGICIEQVESSPYSN